MAFLLPTLDKFPPGVAFFADEFGDPVALVVPDARVVVTLLGEVVEIPAPGTALKPDVFTTDARELEFPEFTELAEAELGALAR